MQVGIFVGHHERTGASLFVAPEGIKRGAGIHRKPEPDRYDYEYQMSCKGTPWESVPVASRPEGAGGAGAGDRQTPAAAGVPAFQPAGAGAAAPAIQPPAVKRGEFYVQSEDIKRFGITHCCMARANADLDIPISGTGHTASAI